MSDVRIQPGDLVEFTFWSHYLAECAFTDIHGNSEWIELHPGDRGIVVAAADGRATTPSDPLKITVLFSRVNRLLLVDRNQLTVV
jgi:hypothetical protein